MGGLGQIRFGDRGLDDGAFALVEDVFANPDDGVDGRYQRLGWSADRGNRMKNELLEQGILEGQVVKVGNTRKLLLRITDVARRELGFQGTSSGEARRESITHEHWKRFYAERFREKGYQVFVEASRRNGRVDVLAVKRGENGTRAAERVAIEIETGKSDVVWNVRQDLLMRWKVMVVATERKAFEVIEKDLAKNGLLVPSSVGLVLAGERVDGQRF